LNAPAGSNRYSPCPPPTADYIPAGDSIMFLGNAYFNYSNQTIDFRREQPFAPYESPGSPFTQLGPNLGFVWQNEFTNLPISQIGTGSNQWCGANCLVTMVNTTARSAHG
jgi:hypothetical protein